MALFRADRIQATYNGNLESVKHNAVMKNGSLIHLGALLTGEREVKAVVVPTADTIKVDEVLVVYTPEILYDERLTMKDFVIESGKVARAYHLVKGDIITIDAELVDVTLVEGDLVVPTGLTYKKDNANASLSLFTAEVIEVTTLGFDERPAYAVQIKTI